MDRADIPPIALTHTTGDDEMTDLDKKKAIAAYHAATTFMDAHRRVIRSRSRHARIHESSFWRQGLSNQTTAQRDSAPGLARCVPSG